MTDEQIIRALECCKEICAPPCGKCPLNDAEGTCEEELIGYALDLINRQKAEIENLKEKSDYYEKMGNEIIKELSEQDGNIV